MSRDSAAKPLSGAQWVGLHERLDTPRVRQALEALGLEDRARWSQGLEGDDLGMALAAELAQRLAERAGELREKGHEDWVRAVQGLADALAAAGHPLSGIEEDLPQPPFRQLLEVRSPSADQVGQQETPRPDVPLALSSLLTGSDRTPSLVTQIEKELASAVRADWLVSFIKWSGIRALRETLKRFTETPTADGSPRLRIATTSYLGATDLKAIDFLLSLPNTEIRVSYDTHRTRLHAKAYLFHRSTGFGSAYIGSANVSRVAMDEGLEWTAKVSEYELPHMWRQIQTSFEAHWADPAEFEPLTKDDLPRLQRALESESSSGHGAQKDATAFFDLRPYAFQQEILEDIQRERCSGIDRHLVIAATGTGKTMIAAFDYRRFAHEQADKGRPSLLFIAHREEILRQAMASFRQVLQDHEFGDVLVGGARPSQDRHLFCTVQSWNARDLDRLDPAHFDYVVLDEAHHSTAGSYQRILEHVRPKCLLGLTATPERTDADDIRKHFGQRYTHEIRLPDAIERRLLVPFHYFGVADHESVDLSRVSWRRGGYDAEELEGVFTGNRARADWVLRQAQEHATDLGSVRGLGFCISCDHARFMAEHFSAKQVPSAVLTGESPDHERLSVQRDLRAGRIRFIFTVDLYNEGVDLPEVDTVLLLRPTESLTVYLQQMGRGLRLHEGKPHLTVLDFVAPQNRRFRYAARFRALSARPEKRVDHQIQEGFPWLPSGCLIHLDRLATQHVLDNIRAQINRQRPQLVRELKDCFREDIDSASLPKMLDCLHMDKAEDLLRKDLPSRLRADCGGESTEALGPYASGLKRGLQRLARCDDHQLLETLQTHLAQPAANVEQLAEEDRLRLALVHSTLWGKTRPGDGDLTAVDAFVREQRPLYRDLQEVAAWRHERIVPASGISFPEQTGPLELHASYTREQILLALGLGSLEKPITQQEGVRHVPDRRVDALFVTLEKSEQEFSPTTMYEDYALNERRFHWQSQSGTSPTSETGQRYIHHEQLGYTPMLFIRRAKRDATGLSEPFTFCGPVRYQHHEGSKPMSIIWELEYELPARLLHLARRTVL
ncbi:MULTISPECIES: DUF3427 domain-containing protein [unclassified Thioalkalivibrio]|uniref:DUF3427 domain-containing protein n=1 Tax=unclassified Thioalkalivibrio TaxID=2621013 RepID=UPI00036461C8|nr:MULTISPECIES: DUF3427 domain-containing protein [unclassified Thioalkalivibrio]